MFCVYHFQKNHYTAPYDSCFRLHKAFLITAFRLGNNPDNPVHNDPLWTGQGREWKQKYATHPNDQDCQAE